MEELVQRGRILNWCLGLTIILTLVWTSQGALFCHECLENESSQFCNISSNQQQCDDDSEVCVTTVMNRQGALYTKKSCVLSDICNIAEQTNSGDCAVGVVTNKCTYCCTGDLCNYDRFRYSPTTPAPTTTTLATTTSTDMMVEFITTVAPPTCDSQNLTKCVSAYGDLILFAMADPRANFPYFCRQVPSMFQCVANAMASCCPDNQLVVQEKLNLVAERLWAQCPRECDADQGRICTSGIITKVITGIVSGNTSCTELKSEIHILQTCIVIHVGTCGDVIRVGFENNVKVIEGALEISCTNRSSDTTQAPPPSGVTTQSPADCDEDSASACLVSLAQNLTGSQPPEKDIICQVLIPEVESCLEEHLKSCPADVKERFDRALNFTLELADDVTDDCTPTTEEPPTCDTTAARACALVIYDVIDKQGDYGKACQMVNETIACVLANVTDCTEREKVSLNRTLDLILQTLEGKCDKYIKLETECKDLELEEGAGEKTVTFKSNYDPKILCAGEPDCKIYVDIAFEKGTTPKCRDGTVIEQIVCRPEVPPTSGWPCSVEITSDNWEESHNVYIAATIDGKTDGNQVREMTLVYKKVVQGQVKELMSMDTCQITVIDHDTSGQCESINDPHIKTFDGVLYDNFYEGFFTLYRHQHLPCEVQALYQRCRIQNFYGTCNCGVAIKSGDYVFFAESCRRKQSFCRRRHHCYNLLRAKSFVWDGVTDGTRIFRRPTGFETCDSDSIEIPIGQVHCEVLFHFKVQLPHGTRIKIQYYRHENLINIWIVPSAGDYMNTTGLCGFYDGQKEDDLLLPDGSVYTGGHVGQFQQPRDFCKAWRITDSSKRIYNGVPHDPWYPHQYCTCKGQDCSEVDCQAEHLVSTCDLDNSGEIAVDQMPGIKPSDVQTRNKRAADEPNIFEFDVEYEPPNDPRLADRKWTEADAKTFCKSYFDDSEIAQLCRFQVQMDIQHHIDICVQDILLADDTNFAVSAMEGLKESCSNDVKTDPKFSDTDVGRRTADDVGNKKCDQDCSKHGDCVKGKCVCNEEYVGDVCDVKADSIPRYVSGDEDGLCDVRRGDCSAIVVFADNIIKSDKLTCHLTAVDVTESGVKNSSDQSTMKAEWISSTQVTCRVPDNRSRGHYVMLSNDGRHQSTDAFLHISHDPVCHDCRFSENNAYCSRKPDNCIIDGRCYGNGETLLADACSVCDPSTSDSSFKRIKNLACIGAVAIIVALVAAIFIIIIMAVVVMYCCCKRKNKKSTPEEGVRHELIRKFKTDSPKL